MFASGLGVEELNAREDGGWSLRAMAIGEQFSFSAAKATLPPASDLLLLFRKDGKIRFFTHASRPVPQAGDTVLAYVPPDTEPVVPAENGGHRYATEAEVREAVSTEEKER